MNERILELAEQAGAEFWQRLENDVVNPEAYITFDPPEGLEKFAELIVKECLDQCYNRGMNDALYAGQLKAAAYIEEHFGVSV